MYQGKGKGKGRGSSGFLERVEEAKDWGETPTAVPTEDEEAKGVVVDMI